MATYAMYDAGHLDLFNSTPSKWSHFVHLTFSHPPGSATLA